MPPELEEFLAEQLLITSDPVGTCIRRMVESYRETDLAFFVLATVGLAADLEMSNDVPEYPPGLSDQLYRAAALLSVDILHLSLADGRVPASAALLDHWTATGEPVFAPN